MRQMNKSKACVWRWRQRFAQGRFDGLLRGNTGPSHIKPLDDETTALVVALTLKGPAGETTHWTSALMT